MVTLILERWAFHAMQMELRWLMEMTNVLLLKCNELKFAFKTRYDYCRLILNLNFACKYGCYSNVYNSVYGRRKLHVPMYCITAN